METLLIISHEVKNFDTWKTAFDKGETTRAQFGVTIKGVYRSPENENWITVISEAPSAEAAKSLITNPSLRTEMESAGVISTPDVKILTNVTSVN
jgi:hypothetical protein